MPSALNVPDSARNLRLTFGVKDDFDHYVTADTWTTVASNSGTVTVSDAVGGIVALAASDSTAADNDETYLHTTAELFKFAANKPITLDAYIQFTEANTDDANIAVGLADAIAADAIVDNGAGIKTSFSGAVIYKVDGGTVWKFVTSNGATQTISTSDTTAGGASYQRLTIEVRHQDASNCSIVPLVDGVQLQTSAGVNIEHKVAYASATEMQAFLGVKNGGANAETLNCDYFYCGQKR